MPLLWPEGEEQRLLTHSCLFYNEGFAVFKPRIVQMPRHAKVCDVLPFLRFLLPKVSVQLNGEGVWSLATHVQSPKYLESMAMAIQILHCITIAFWQNKVRKSTPEQEQQPSNSTLPMASSESEPGLWGTCITPPGSLWRLRRVWVFSIHWACWMLAVSWETSI